MTNSLIDQTAFSTEKPGEKRTGLIDKWSEEWYLLPDMSYKSHINFIKQKLKEEREKQENIKGDNAQMYELKTCFIKLQRAQGKIDLINELIGEQEK